MAGDLNLLEAQRAVFMSDMTPSEKLVALALLNHWSRASDTFPSVERLATWTSLDRRTVIRVLGQLEERKAISVTRSVGRANRYELGRLMSVTSDTTPPVTPDHGCHDVTPPVILDHPTRDPGSPEVIQVRDPGKRSKISRSSARTKSQGELPLADPEAGRQHQEVVDLYFELYERVRGEKPVFDSQDAKAAKKLREKVGLERAKQALQGAFAHDWWRSTATIRTIANEPAKFLGLKSQPGARRVGTQNDATVEELADHAARVRAATGGSQ